jgi:hypothetical protein
MMRIPTNRYQQSLQWQGADNSREKYVICLTNCQKFNFGMDLSVAVTLGHFTKSTAGEGPFGSRKTCTAEPSPDSSTFLKGNLLQ